MPDVLRSIAAAFLLSSLPLAARAEGVNFTVPDGYLVADPGIVGGDQTVYRRWDRVISGALHTIVVEARPPKDDFTALMTLIVASLRDSWHAVDISRTDAGPLCGAASVRIAYRFPFGEGRTYVLRHVPVNGRFLVAAYDHPTASPEDPAALAALDTLCSGIHQPAGPAGWTIAAPAPANGNAWSSPSAGDSQIVQVARPAQPGRDLGVAPYAGEGAVAANRIEACGAVWIRRVTANLGGGRSVESAAGTVNGYDYVVTYVRPSSRSADPAALATLTSFCADTLPPS